MPISCFYFSISERCRRPVLLLYQQRRPSHLLRRWYNKASDSLVTLAHTQQAFRYDADHVTPKHSSLLRPIGSDASVFKSNFCKSSYLNYVYDYENPVNTLCVSYLCRGSLFRETADAQSYGLGCKKRGLRFITSQHIVSSESRDKKQKDNDYWGSAGDLF